jgi:hypothetical protein
MSASIRVAIVDRAWPVRAISSARVRGRLSRRSWKNSPVPRGGGVLGAASSGTSAATGHHLLVERMTV